MIQPDLRFTLPIRPGQKTAVLGPYPDLAEAIAGAGSPTILITPPDTTSGAKSPHSYQTLEHNGRPPWPLTPTSLNHLLLPIVFGPGSMDAALNEMTRVLEPGGWFFYGLPNVPLLKRAFMPSTMHRSLGHGGRFRQLTIYGIYPSLHRPRFLIPIRDSGPAYHFYHRILASHSLRGWRAQRLAASLARMGLQKLLFNDFGIVAQRV